MITVLNVVGRMDRGGLETFVMNVLRNADTSLIHCDILCTLRGVGDYEAEAKELGACVFHIGEVFQAHCGKLRFIGQFREYRKWFSKHPYDVIHIHGSHAFDNLIAVGAALICGCGKVVCHSHTNDGEHKKLNALAASCLRKLPIIRLACSKQAGEWLYGRSDCFEVIKNGINVEKFAFKESGRRECRAQLDISDDDKVIAHTGRLVDVKNQPFLLDVLANLLRNDSDRWFLLLVGAGENEEKLRDKALAQGIERHVQFLGLRNDIPRILSAADVYVMPSIHEGLPLAAVEAQANGLPTLISSGMSPETKLRTSTRVMDLDSGTDAWASAVVEMVSAKQMRGRHLGAREVRAAGFDISATVGRLCEIYEAPEVENHRR